MYHLKERYIRRALQSDSVQHTPLRKLQVLTQLATALDRLNKYEEGIRICTEAIELAQEQGQKAKESELLFTLGRMYQGMKLDDKAFRYMYRSIELLQARTMCANWPNYPPPTATCPPIWPKTSVWTKPLPSARSVSTLSAA